MSNDVSVDLIRSLIEHMQGANDEWESFAMVIGFSGGRISGTYGYAYSPDGVISAVVSRPSGVMPALTAYTESYYEPGQALPVKLLVRFDRVTGRYEVTFEDTDVNRWQVTPANIDEIREELRPKFV